MQESTAIEIIKLVGSIAGVIALGWRLIDVLGTYLQIELSALQERGSGRIKISTAVENKYHIGKRLEAAFLLIGPETDRPRQVVRSLEKLYPSLGEFRSLNEMVSKIAKTICRDTELTLQGLFDGDGRAIVPLTYYYRENVSVGDERLTYTCTVDQSKFPPGSYAVRFYVEPKGKRLFRSVQSIFESLPQPTEK